jgi:spore germination protein (amino acid permease)
VYSYSGFEFVLLLIPFIRKPDKVFRAGVTAFAIVTGIYTVVVISVYGRLGIAETKEMIWPTLAAIKSIDVPGAFVERLEGLAMTAWVLFAFTSIAPVTYGISLMASRELKHREFKHFCPLCVPIIYLVAMVPESVVEAYEYVERASLYLGTPAIFGVPILLLVIARIRKLGVKKNA